MHSGTRGRHAWRSPSGLWLVAGALPAAAAGDVQMDRRQGRRPLQRPDAAGRGQQGRHGRLDKQGRPVKKIEPAPTPEQLHGQGGRGRPAEGHRQGQAGEARADRALLQSYTSEEEIDLARNRAISAIESQIKSAESYSADLNAP